MKSICTFAISSLLFLAFCRPAGAWSIAVFPLLDLTKDTNGVNMPLTDYLRRQTEMQVNKVIADQDIMAFMIRHRIRTLGKLDTVAIERARNEIGADLILLGTVCQLQKAPSATVSLSLQLIRTSDKKTVWTTTKDLNQADLQSLLALSDPETLDDLFDVYFPSLLDSFPLDIDTNVETKEKLNIGSIVLRPEYVQPGQTVHCRVRLNEIRQTGNNEDGREVSIRVGGAMYPAVIDEEEKFITASWPAQDIAGAYPVALVVKWPSGQQEETIFGRYQVDVIPPDLKMYLIGPEVDGRATFNRFLTIMTTMADPEPISKWTVAVFDKDDEPIVFQEEAGQVPKRITWNGFTSRGIPAQDGDYLIRIIVWDRAGLSGTAEHMVSLRRTPPEVSLDVEKQDRHLKIAMENSVATPLLYWWLRVYEDGGRIVKTADGDNFPATVTLELPEKIDSSKFELLLEALDVLGNKVRRKVDDLVALTAKEQDQDTETESQWLEEF